MSMYLEALEWHDIEAGAMPDAETTVLVWVADVDGFGPGDWAAGWWDGEAWRDCASGGVIEGRAVAWAQPEGPRLT